MTDEALTHVMAELFAAIQMLSGYPVPASMPPVHRLPQAQLEARVCGRPCGVRGFYLRGEGVFIDQALDLERSVRARSILLHELVHHLQGVSGRFDTLSECHGWYAKEHEAYRIQNDYLRWEGTPGTFYLETGWRDCALKNAR